MGYDIYLAKRIPEENESIETFPVTRFCEGGVQQLGGCTSTEISITYNYSKLFSFGDLDGQRAIDTISELEEATIKYGIRTSDNYWDPTPGNVGYACQILLGWAKIYPEAFWVVH